MSSLKIVSLRPLWWRVDCTSVRSARAVFTTLDSDNSITIQRQRRSVYIVGDWDPTKLAVG